MLLLPPLLPRLHSHSAALVRVCLLSLASSCSPTPFPRSHSPTPVRPFSCTRSRSHSPALPLVYAHPRSHSPVCIRVCLFTFVFARSCSCLPVRVHVCPLLFAIAAVPAAAVCCWHSFALPQCLLSAYIHS